MLTKQLAAIGALLVLLIVTVAAGLGNILLAKPEIALRIAPWDARAAGLLSQQALVEGPAQYGRAETFARQALARDPTIIAAVVTLGAIAAAGRNDTGSVQRFEYAARLSRRNLPTQLWWIERSVAEGDVGKALHHYDIALRAISKSPDLLFPTLGTAVAEPAVRSKLTRLFVTGAPWRNRFLDWLVTNGVNNRPAGMILAQMRAARRTVDPGLFGRVEQGLIDQGDYETAWSFYRQRHPGARRDAAQDQQFSAAATGERSPFDWSIPAEDGTASIGALGRRYALTFMTVPTQASTLARQFMLLPPGRYRLQVDAGLEGGSGDGAPYWSLQCTGNRELGRAPLNGSSVTFNVPVDCSSQWLILRHDANDLSSATTGLVKKVQLVRKK